MTELFQIIDDVKADGRTGRLARIEVPFCATEVFQLVGKVKGDCSDVGPNVSWGVTDHVAGSREIHVVERTGTLEEFTTLQ